MNKVITGLTNYPHLTLFHQVANLLFFFLLHVSLYATTFFFHVGHNWRPLENHTPTSPSFAQESIWVSWEYDIFTYIHICTYVCTYIHKCIQTYLPISTLIYLPTSPTIGCASGWNRILEYMQYNEDIPWAIIFNADIYVPPGNAKLHVFCVQIHRQ